MKIEDISSSLNKTNNKWYFAQFKRAQIKYFRKYHKNKLFLLKSIVIFDYLYAFFKPITKNRKEIVQTIANVIRY